MKYYSEVTKKLYDSEKELTAAEAEVTKSKADRAKEAKEVTEALKAANEAQKKANEMLNAFVKKYGSFKTTLTGEDAEVKDGLFSLFDKIFW